MKNNCPSCHKEKAQTHHLLGVLPGAKCQARQRVKSKKMRYAPHFNTITMADRIQSQRDHNGGDIQQPWLPNGEINEGFIKNNPKDIVETYFTQEDLKNL